MVQYRLFDNIIEKDKTNSFVVAATELFSQLEIEVSILKNSKPDIATEGKTLNEEIFLYNCAYNLAVAKTQDASIVCVEDSSYTSFHIAKTVLAENSDLRDAVRLRLIKDNLELSLDTKVLHVNEILRDVVGLNKLQKMIKRPFDKFNVAIFNGNKIENLDINSTILTILGAKLVSFETQNDSNGYEILKASKILADKLAGKIMLDIFDRASDFVVTNDARSFVMFELRQKNLEHSVGRDINLSVFSTTQVVLMALGCDDKTKLGLDFHKIPTVLI
ncbi:MAG: heterodisulfide reductase [Sulfurospirillum sp.]|nr:heterodisulfide reductase [Sulfurospirillum sp.]MBL0702488.1 heterodisulfide reductase [Sulfurospirillum sp.]